MDGSVKLPARRQRETMMNKISYTEFSGDRRMASRGKAAMRGPTPRLSCKS